MVDEGIGVFEVESISWVVYVAEGNLPNAGNEGDEGNEDNEVNWVKQGQQGQRGH